MCGQDNEGQSKFYCFYDNTNCPGCPFSKKCTTKYSSRQIITDTTIKWTFRVDKVLTHKYFGFIFFCIIMSCVFGVTFLLGKYPMDWLVSAFELLSKRLNLLFTNDVVRSVIVDGIINGVCSVIIFLPQIVLLHTCIAILKESGYMSRVAFIFDRVMHKFGMQGESVIAIIMGYGCNVTAILSTQSKNNKYKYKYLITALIIPMFSCSARVPVYLYILNTYLNTPHKYLILASLYLLSTFVALCSSYIFNIYIGHSLSLSTIKLLPYHIPSFRSILQQAYYQGKQYLKKIGGVVFGASLIVWGLSYFPHGNQISDKSQLEQSYIGQLGKALTPVFQIQGFDWKMSAAIVSGINAKEAIVPTLSVLHDNQDNVSKVTAYAYLIFILFYCPCIATIASLNKVLSLKWGIFEIIYTTTIAWFLSALVSLIGTHI